MAKSAESPGSGQSTSHFTPEFDAKVERLLETWHVPGLAIGLIEGSSTSYKGYGLSMLPDTPVTPETVFFTASTTKSFTAASVALLIDDAKSPASSYPGPPDLSWQTTLSSILGESFQLDNEDATSHATLEDGLSNRTGMPGHTFSFKPKTATVKDITRSLRDLPTAAGLREQYFYSSYMFSTVSDAIETITSTGLGDFMRQRLWNPLGMTRTYWTPAEATEAAASGTVLARGYAWDDSEQEFVEEEVPGFPAVSGAGAMISNVVDYTKWLQCMMTKSAPLSPSAHETLTTPRISFSAQGHNPFPPPHSYALGWFIESYRGHRIVWHSGGWTGFGTSMMYVPDHQWGLVMLGNTSGTSNHVQMTLFMEMLDDLFDAPQENRVDWGREFQNRFQQRRNDIARSRERLYPSLPSPPLPPSLSHQKYAGAYFHAAYGDMNFKPQGDTLVASRLTREIPMVIQIAHVSGESWLATLKIVNQDPRDHLLVRAEFQVGADGTATRVGLDLEPALAGKMIWFDRTNSE